MLPKGACSTPPLEHGLISSQIILHLWLYVAKQRCGYMWHVWLSSAIQVPLLAGSGSGCTSMLSAPAFAAQGCLLQQRPLLPG